jgi:alkanesulfonate monooxygenase SsuD/methylene tetrahydromethanopterin reductase-like flavin-dependent oxidoreductase (luciferase family)
MSVPSLYTVAAGVKTHHIRLGPMGYVPALHNPLRLVEEIAVADQILQGRFECGIVPGITPDYFTPFNADFQGRRERAKELIALIKMAYTSPEPFDFEGPYHQFKNVRLSVKPVQKPYPPIWLDTRDPETLKFCAKEGLSTGYFILLPRDEAAVRYKEFLHWWKEAGWAHKPNIAYLTLVYVDETDAKARERVKPHALQAFPTLVPGTGGEEAKEVARKMAEFFETRGDKGAGEIIRNIRDFDYLLEHDLIFVGSPDTVARKLKEHSVSGVFNTFFGEFNFGAMPEEDLMRSIRLFGTEVAPQLRSFEPY